MVHQCSGSAPGSSTAPTTITHRRCGHSGRRSGWPATRRLIRVLGRSHGQLYHDDLYVNEFFQWNSRLRRRRWQQPTSAQFACSAFLFCFCFCFCFCCCPVFGHFSFSFLRLGKLLGSFDHAHNFYDLFSVRFHYYLCSAFFGAPGRQQKRSHRLGHRPQSPEPVRRKSCCFCICCCCLASSFSYCGFSLCLFFAFSYYYLHGKASFPFVVCYFCCFFLVAVVVV